MCHDQGPQSLQHDWSCSCILGSNHELQVIVTTTLVLFMNMSWSRSSKLVLHTIARLCSCTSAQLSWELKLLSQLVLFMYVQFQSRSSKLASWSQVSSTYSSLTKNLSVLPFMIIKVCIIIASHPHQAPSAASSCSSWGASQPELQFHCASAAHSSGLGQ